MTTNTTPISVTYSDSKLRILEEEFIAMQCSEISFKDVCSYILYRAMEEEKTTTSGLFESNQLHEDDCKRVSSILEKIVAEGRITMNTCIDSKQYTKKNSVLYTR